jgi:hypothetical protein
MLRIADGTAAEPPSDEALRRLESVTGVALPADFVAFLRSANGARPETPEVPVEGRERLIEHFLAVLDDPAEHPSGWADIEVVMTQIDDRLVGEDEVGTRLVPFAAVFGGDFLVLDFRRDPDGPAIGLWDHNRSEEFAPFVVDVAESFTAFAELCHATAD